MRNFRSLMRLSGYKPRFTSYAVRLFGPLERDLGRAATGTSLLFVALVLGQALGATAAGAVAAVWGLAATFVLAAEVTGAAVAVPHWPKTVNETPQPERRSKQWDAL